MNTRKDVYGFLRFAPGLAKDTVMIELPNAHPPPSLTHNLPPQNYSGYERILCIDDFNRTHQLVPICHPAHKLQAGPKCERERQLKCPFY